MTIINLRGTNGSGKSTVVHTILKNHAHIAVPLALYETPAGAIRHVPGIKVPALDLTIVGAYDTQCSGADNIRGQVRLRASVLIAAGYSRNVIFEGVIISTIWSSYYAFAKTFERRYVWAYMDTPAEVCEERVRKRNKNKEGVNYGSIYDKARAINSTATKALEAGCEVAWIQHRHAVADVMGLLE